MDKQSQVKISVANKEYLVDCPAGKESALISAASLFNSKIAQLNSKTPAEVEQNLVMVALNLCHELTKCKQDFAAYQQQTKLKLKDVQEKIERAQVE